MGLKQRGESIPRGDSTHATRYSKESSPSRACYASHADDQPEASRSPVHWSRRSKFCPRVRVLSLYIERRFPSYVHATPDAPMRLPLTRWLLALSVWIAGHGLMGFGVCVCACVIACARDVRADSLVVDVPIVGGTAALSRALGIDPVPERARFMTELVHVIYDAPEGKSASRDALRAQVAAYLEAADRVRAALAAASLPAPASACRSRIRRTTARDSSAFSTSSG